jgi:hypothetical protein
VKIGKSVNEFQKTFFKVLFSTNSNILLNKNLVNVLSYLKCLANLAFASRNYDICFINQIRNVLSNSIQFIWELALAQIRNS